MNLTVLGFGVSSVCINMLNTTTDCSNLAFVQQFLDEALKSQSWVWKEARKVLRRLENRSSGVVTFQTGFGPSGLPHIGTFGEVLRTTMVVNAFARLAPEKKVRLIVFSDDMDGLRKVPDNVPDPGTMEEQLGMPLSLIPDPHGEAESFAHYNNAKLVEFLDSFGLTTSFDRRIVFINRVSSMIFLQKCWTSTMKF